VRVDLSSNLGAVANRRTLKLRSRLTISIVLFPLLLQKMIQVLLLALSPVPKRRRGPCRGRSCCSVGRLVFCGRLRNARWWQPETFKQDVTPVDVRGGKGLALPVQIAARRDTKKQFGCFQAFSIPGTARAFQSYDCRDPGIGR
jgi:hypothetical protein